MQGSPNITQKIDNAIDKLEYFIDQQLTRLNNSHKRNRENSPKKESIQPENILKEKNNKKIVIPLLKLDSLGKEESGKENLSDLSNLISNQKKPENKKKSNNMTIHRNKKKEARFLSDEEMMRKWFKQVNPLGVEIPKDLKDFLRDGSFLCHLLNSFKPNSIKTIFEAPCKPFLFRNNIESFLKCCKELKVEEDYLFEVDDLYEFKNLEKVYLCLLNLSEILIDSSQKKISEAKPESNDPTTLKKQSLLISPKFYHPSSNFSLSLNESNPSIQPSSLDQIPKPSNHQPSTPKSPNKFNLSISSPRSNLPSSPRSSSKSKVPSSPRSSNKSNLPSSPRSSSNPKSVAPLSPRSSSKTNAPSSPRSNVPSTPRSAPTSPRSFNFQCSPRSNISRINNERLNSPEKDEILRNYIKKYLKSNGINEQIDLSKIEGNNYMIGNMQVKLRIFKSQVYVRVAGGFEILTQFLSKKLNSKALSPNKSPRSPKSKKLCLFRQEKENK